MAISITVFDAETGRSKAVSVDFRVDVLAPDDAVLDSYFCFSTSAQDEDGVTIPVKVAREPADLAIGVKQSAANESAAYASVDALVRDYVYDMVRGHVADQWSTGCALQKPMEF